MNNHIFQNSLYQGIILCLLLLCSCKADPITISQTANLAPPIFEVTITNTRTKQMISKDEAVISAKGKDILEINLWSKDFSRYPNNRITVTSFDTTISVEDKESYKGEITVSQSLTPGKYPLTIEYNRIVTVSENEQYIGIDKSKKTFYISVE